jgi:hypothetical protein
MTISYKYRVIAPGGARAGSFIELHPSEEHGTADGAIVPRGPIGLFSRAPDALALFVDGAEVSVTIELAEAQSESPERA